MLAAVANALRVKELRNRILFTAAMLLLYRAGSWLPTPGVNTAEIQNLFSGGAGSTILGYLNLFSGQALQNLSFFALGIMPYITASIIMQLMTVVLPKLEALQKEGEAGQKKITQYTRYLTVILALLQSIGYVILFHNGSVLGGSNSLTSLTPRSFILIVVTLTAGTTVLMWMGELITQRGIGNGQSLLIFASILVSLPVGVRAWANSGTFQKLSLPIIILAVVVAVVFGLLLPIAGAPAELETPPTSGEGAIGRESANLASVWLTLAGGVGNCGVGSGRQSPALDWFPSCSLPPA